MFTYRPMRNKVVVLKGERPVGTIKRHKFHDGVVVSVRGIMSPSATPGRAFYKTIDEAMAALEEEASRRQNRPAAKPRVSKRRPSLDKQPRG